jgi:hypothetical protein
MMRSRYLFSVWPERRSGLAAPTFVAAIACGGSVLAIAATGAVALDSSEPVAVGLPAVIPADGAAAGPGASGGRRASDGSSATPSAGGIFSLGSAIPPAGTRHVGTRAPRRPRPVSPTRAVIAAGTVPTPAATAVVHSIAVLGGGFDTLPVPPADRGPLTAPRVIAAADPTVIVLDPTPTPSVVPTATPTATPTPSDDVASPSDTVAPPSDTVAPPADAPVSPAASEEPSLSSESPRDRMAGSVPATSSATADQSPEGSPPSS